VKLTVVNGSPRGKGSNTTILLDHFLAGFAETPGNAHEAIYLIQESGRREAVAAFAAAEVVLLAFPLYTDAMPGIVKEFIESLAVYKGREGNAKLLFLVQSGFPEGSHTGQIIPYLAKLAARLGSPYGGTIRKGGVEGIQSQPEFMTRSLFNGFRRLGQGFGATSRLDEGLLRAMAGRERLPKLALVAASKISELLYWNPQLRKNGVFEQRFARPYA
jgi:hypothetical protein